jgi:hypothetical protein
MRRVVRNLLNGKPGRSLGCARYHSRDEIAGFGCGGKGALNIRHLFRLVPGWPHGNEALQGESE